MKKYIIILVIQCLYSLGFAQGGSQIEFKIRNLGVNVDGYFGTFTINASFDNDRNLTDVNASIDVASIDTGIEGRDKHLLKEDYFDVENHKTIQLETTRVDKESDTSYQLNAKLTIKGTTKTVDIPIKIEQTESSSLLSAYFELNRKDYGVGGGSLVMSKTVKITVKHRHYF
ncbi:MAG: YceI family protein [Bacteroidota bacterium]